MAVLTLLKSSLYQDSVKLMRLSQTLSGLSGVRQAFVAMGTDANKRVLAEAKLLTDDAQRAGVNDLFIVVEAENAAAAEQAVASAEGLLVTSASKPNGATAAPTPRTFDRALRQQPASNLMLISVPGAYAALEAAKALHANQHVFLFSDNVSIDDELTLKQLAVSKGLLMMGPGCGTAVINGAALAFANALKRGPVGIVGASGTGLQELSTLIDRGGLGVSQAIGVGGRDLSEKIGGLMMLQGIGMLAADPATEIIAIISKPPQASVLPNVLAAARASGKPIIVNFLGRKESGEREGIHFTHTIEDTAEKVLQVARGDSACTYSLTDAEFTRLVAGERARLKPGRRFVRGLYSGGSLCDEAMDLLIEKFGGVYSNIAFAPEWALEDAWRSKGHCCVDMGEEEFTRGRPHPMIDPRLRQERITREADDPEVAVILMDVVIGYGSHDDPAGELAHSIRVAKAKAEAAGRYLSVVAHVCGTAQDPQGLDEQERKLRAVGAVVLPTNAQAARAAAAIGE
ncbi:MAG: acyl-CoA synthetase FdrA [Anaerolineales bacterium]